LTREDLCFEFVQAAISLTEFRQPNLCLYQPKNSKSNYGIKKKSAFGKRKNDHTEFSVTFQKKNSTAKNKSSCTNIKFLGSGHKRQKPRALTPQAPIRNSHTRKVANAKGLNRNTNLT